MLKIVLSALMMILFAHSAWATSDIEIDTDINSPTVATPQAKPAEPAVEPTPMPLATPTVMIQAQSKSMSETPVSAVPSPEPGQGILQMREVYKAGMVYYKKQDFARAIRYLKQSLQMKDPYTPKYYYAEANAILGVIYQFHIIDKSLAYHYYREALNIDPSTATAKKHIAEVTTGDEQE